MLSLEKRTFCSRIVSNPIWRCEYFKKMEVAEEQLPPRGQRRSHLRCNCPPFQTSVSDQICQIRHIVVTAPPPVDIWGICADTKDKRFELEHFAEKSWVEVSLVGLGPAGWFCQSSKQPQNPHEVSTFHITNANTLQNLSNTHTGRKKSLKSMVLMMNR